MELKDLTIEVRDTNLNRVGQLLPSDLVGAKFINRKNQVGSWEIRVANDSLMGEQLRTPGYGIIVTGPDGILLSGPTMSAILNQSVENPLGDWVITGTDDSVILMERLAYPLPSEADVTKQSAESDVRTGSAEFVLKQYVDDNIGPTAPAARKIENLVIETDLGRGSIVTGTARFITLQELLYPLAQTGGVGYTIEQTGNDLEFKVYIPQDRSNVVRMDLDNNQLVKTEYSYLAPKATRVIVGGQGEAQDRIFIEQTNDEATAAETVWGRRVETFADARGSGTEQELFQTGDEILVDNGKTIVNTSVIPSDALTMRYGYDWNLGDTITVVINDLEYSAVVTEVGISIESDGVRIQATVGTPTPLSFESKLVSRSVDQETRISSLERNTTGYGVTTVYQPAGGTSGTQPTFSGPAINGTYTRFGNMIHFSIIVDFDNITSFGTGQYFLTLPYDSRNSYQFRDGCLHDVSAGTEYHISGHIFAGGNVLWLNSSDKVGASIQDVDFTSTSPVTLTTADSFHIAGTYEIEV
jgi:hypothetical protein